MVKRLNAPRAGQYNASAIERLTRAEVDSIFPIDATDATKIENLAAIATSGSAANLIAGTVPDARMPAHTGDVTSSAGSVATTIANDAVTYAKMQNVSAASKLLGRGDSGSGDPQEITLGTGLSMSGTTLNASEYTEPWTFVKLTSSVTNATTTPATTGLSVAGSNFLANTYYEFEAQLAVERTAGVGQLNLSLVWASIAAGWAVIINSLGDHTSGNSSATITANIGVTGNSRPATIRGHFYNTGSAGSGTLDIQFSADAAETTVQVWRGSFLKYRAYT